jgi:hypothetical protein
MRERLLLIISIAAIVGGISAIVYVSMSDATSITVFQEPAPIEEAKEPETPPVVEGGITVKYYGGAVDVKTVTEKGVEYALIRNPENVGGLTIVETTPDGSFYYALDNEGNKISYPKGEAKGIHGYNEVGLVSGTLIRDRIPATEYFIAYPDATSARLANFQEVPDTGIANRFLSSQVATITNKNTGVSVIAEIDHRSSQQGTMLISEAVGRELDLSTGATANLLITLTPKESVTLGPVR